MASSSEYPRSPLASTRLKLYFLDRVKIFVISQDLSFTKLIGLVATAFPETSSAAEKRSASLEVAYLDKEGDKVSIDGDESLRLALQDFSDESLLKIQVHLKLEGNGRNHRSDMLKDGGSQRGGPFQAANAPAVCRHFRAGFCKFGSSCRFSHALPNANNRATSRGGITGNAANFRRESDNLEIWLMTQQKASESENISYLTSANGFEKMLLILNHTNLSAKMIHQFVVLVTKQEIRTSLLRQATNKIYGAIVGSAFLTQLHTHIRGSLKPIAADVEPYIALSEELLARTSNGWKEVPLDELKAVVDELSTDDALTSELRYAIARLLEQRLKIKRLNAVDDRSDAYSLSTDFRNLSIIPSKEQLFAGGNARKLPVNQVGLRYPNVAAYLDTHFQLMQEDCMATLRDGVQELRRNSRDPNLRVYTNVRLVGLQCGNESIVYRVSFGCNVRRDKDWESSKRLMFGSLLCISHDRFQTFLWAVVANRSPQLLSQSAVDIRILEGADQRMKANREYTMAESSAAYFEAYSHVLKNLQRPETDNLPFLEHLISLEPHIQEPVYLKSRQNKDIYDFRSVFPNMKEELPNSQLHILQNWPEWASSLDKSQIAALKHGLTKRLALIQGPPGTGKTFIGLLIVRILLENLKRSATRHGFPKIPSPENVPLEKTIGGPIFIVCYTNHALDQFLDGIYAVEKNIIRIGGRSKSDQMMECNLETLLKKQQADQSLQQCLHEASRQAWSRRKELEEEILEHVDRMNVQLVNLQSLHGVATEEQIQFLFYEGCNPNNVVRMWLNEGEKWGEDTQVSEGQSLNNGTLAMYNPYNVLDEEGIDETDVEAKNDDIPAGSQDKMKTILQRNESPDSQKNSDGEWTEVRPKRRSDGKVAKENARMIPNQELHVQEYEWPMDMLVNHMDVWSLDKRSRWRLHQYWLDEIRNDAQHNIAPLSAEYEIACKRKLEVDDEIKLSLLRRAKVVGMTTTAAARCHTLLESLQAEIIIVEEAAEVLESHILACLTPSTKHLILIGDHLQLRPSVAVHRLAVNHHLDVSLFERLVRSGIEYVTLAVQRRMRPCISRLISSVYPMLRDHPSVSAHENIKGVKSNVFFFDHQALEVQKGDDETGKVNVEEAKLVVELCAYLLKQGYTNTDITILSMYKGQIREILHHLTPKLKRNSSLSDESLHKMPRISSVDDYQGEECKIIILSLVRSNLILTKDGPGKIGFLKVSNRVCVALSRARNGLFIFGNGELLAEKSDLWRTVIQELRNAGASYGKELTLCCQNHPGTETRICKPDDFKEAADGGCNRPCDYQLKCGHVCPQRCHPSDHDRVVCPKRCPRKIPSCNHQCQSLCHGSEECPPCDERVEKELPGCGHFQRVACSTLIESVICMEPCPKLLACGHKCCSRCGKTCTFICNKLVERDLPCGHSAKIECHKHPFKYSCKEPCLSILSPGCEHTCMGTCGACKQGKEHIPCRQNCGRNLPCGHSCQSACCQVCPPCSLPCRKRCLHSRCHHKCGDHCVPCVEPCPWNCKHHSCNLLCHELCDRPRCNGACEKLLACGHPCLGLCGEFCPSVCRICTPQFKDIISQMSMEEFDASDRFVQLQDCGHVFEVSGLDTWMDMEQSKSGVSEIQLKQCPECRTPILRSFRYGNVVKPKLGQIEDVKRRIHSFEKTNEGKRLLRDRKYTEAAEKFEAATEQNPALFEAHFGLGCALCGQSKFEQSILLFHFVVKHSSIASAAADLGVRQRTETESTLLQRLSLMKKEVIVRSMADRSLAIKALVQWASALSSLKEFSGAIKICDFVLQEEPDHREASETRRLANNGVVCQVVEAMMGEVGGKGHWYQCPNGHVYVVGECGGPMQTSTCPDCKAVVGGQSHRPAAGNTHSNIDGSSHSAWSNAVGIRDYNLE